MLVGAMMFGYMMSTIGSMVTTMDRRRHSGNGQSERVDDVRNIPRKLHTRAKLHEHYYTRKIEFDEEDIVAASACGGDVDLLRDSLGHFRCSMS